MSNSENKPKIKQSETVVIKRSQINFAAYNPRKKNPKVVEALKRNFKKVGFLGGIQWNSKTGNLIGGHKRTEALDLVYNYDGTEQTDYDIKVEKIELTEKQEKEQNVFLNNKRVQGETDYRLMADLINEIDFEEAGLEQVDIDYIETIVPDFQFASARQIKEDIEDLKTPEQKKEHVKDVKKAVKEGLKNNTHAESYFVVTFKTYDEKAEFLEGIGINGDDIYINAERFLKRLND